VTSSCVHLLEQKGSVYIRKDQLPQDWLGTPIWPEGIPEDEKKVQALALLIPFNS